MDREIVGITITVSPNNIIPIVIVIGVLESYYRALWATPVIVCGIEILNIVVIRAIVDNIETCIVLKDIVVGICSRFSLSTHG